MNETAADPNKSNMSVSLNCLRKRSHSGSGSSCGSSLGPWVCILAAAVEWERPCVADVDSFRAVSRGDRTEYEDVNDRGVARLCGGSGGWRNGDSARESFETAADAWYNGNEGVEALDILSWPKGHCCAAF